MVFVAKSSDDGLSAGFLAIVVASCQLFDLFVADVVVKRRLSLLDSLSTVTP